MRPVALLGTSQAGIKNWAFRNLSVRLIRPENRIMTEDPPYYYMIWEISQLMSLEISGFIITDETIDKDLLRMAHSQCR